MPMLELRDQDKKALAERKAALLERARHACEYLRGLGAREVYLFGSIIRDDFSPQSDVDIAVSGLPFKHVYSVESRISDILGTEEFDLVYLEHAKEHVKSRVLEQGVRVC